MGRVLYFLVFSIAGYVLYLAFDFSRKKPVSFTIPNMIQKDPAVKFPKQMKTEMTLKYTTVSDSVMFITKGKHGDHISDNVDPRSSNSLQNTVDVADGNTVDFLKYASMNSEKSWVRLQKVTYNIPAIPCVPNNSTCDAKRRIVFLKTHKCASTTVMRIFLRATSKYKLKRLHPRHGQMFYKMRNNNPLNVNPMKIRREYVAYNPNVTYDVMLDHMIFDSDVVEAMMPRDTLYIGILRQPFSQFKSAFNFFQIASRLRMQDNHPLEAFLKEPRKYWRNVPKRGYLSFVRNSMSFDFGFPDDNEDLRNNDTFIENYIDFIDKRFDFVIIAEMLDQSLVLLRRLLCWPMEDVLYNTLNKKDYEFKYLNKTDLLRLHRKWSKADYKIYEHFATKLNNTIQAQGKDFYQELKVFQEALVVLSECTTVRYFFRCNEKQKAFLDDNVYAYC